MVNAIEVETSKEEYDDMLDDCYPMVVIGNIELYPSRVLRECDPIAYNVGYSDYCSHNEQWDCEECGTRFDTEEDAEECCCSEVTE